MNDEEIRPEERILPDEQPRAKRRLKRSIRETVWMLAISVAVVVVIRLFVFELAIVEGPSMEPTLYTNNRVLVMKWTALFNRIPK